MKKLIAFILAIVTVLSLAACGVKVDEDKKDDEKVEENEKNDKDSENEPDFEAVEVGTKLSAPEVTPDVESLCDFYFNTTAKDNNGGEESVVDFTISVMGLNTDETVFYRSNGKYAAMYIFNNEDKTVEHYYGYSEEGSITTLEKQSGEYSYDEEWQYWMMGNLPSYSGLFFEEYLAANKIALIKAEDEDGCLVYDFDLSEMLEQGEAMGVEEASGRVFIDKSTGLIKKMTMEIVSFGEEMIAGITVNDYSLTEHCIPDFELVDPENEDENENEPDFEAVEVGTKLSAPEVTPDVESLCDLYFKTTNKGNNGGEESVEDFTISVKGLNTDEPVFYRSNGKTATMYIFNKEDKTVENYHGYSEEGSITTLKKTDGEYSYDEEWQYCMMETLPPYSGLFFEEYLAAKKIALIKAEDEDGCLVYDFDFSEMLEQAEAMGVEVASGRVFIDKSTGLIKKMTMDIVSFGEEMIAEMTVNDYSLTEYCIPDFELVDPEDLNGTKILETDEFGNTIKEVFLKDGEAQYTKEYEYDSDNRVIEETTINSDGSKYGKGYEYDEAGNLVYCIEIYYDSNSGEVSYVAVTDANSGNTVKSMSYDSDGRVGVEAEYDSNGNRVIERSYDYEDETIYITQYKEGELRDTQIITDLDGTVQVSRYYEHDSEGREIKMTSYDADGDMLEYTTTEYYENMERINWYDYNGEFYMYGIFEYDEDGHEINRTYYDPDGNLIR